VKRERIANRWSIVLVRPAIAKRKPSVPPQTFLDFPRFGAVPEREIRLAARAKTRNLFGLDGPLGLLFGHVLDRWLGDLATSRKQRDHDQQAGNPHTSMANAD